MTNIVYSNKVENGNIFLIEGSTFTLRFTINDKDGVPIDITGAGLSFSVRKTKLTGDVAILKRNLQAGGSEDEMTVFDGINGIFKLFLLPNDSINLEDGIYVWDVEIELALSNIIKTEPKKLELIKTITR